MAYNDKHGADSTLLVRSWKHSLQDKRQVFRLLSALLITGQQKEDKGEVSSITMCADNRFVGVENKTPRGKLLTFTRNYGKINFILLINTKK